MGVALLDSSAVVAFLDADDALHVAADRAVRAVAREHTLAVSAVTIAELLTGAKRGRHGRHDEQVLRRFLSQVVRGRLPVDEQVAERSAELRAANRGLRTPEALILATGDLHADVVVTGDARWAKVSGVAAEIVTSS